MPWKIDQAHTEITFSVRHMMVTNVRGRFEKFDVEVHFDEENPQNSFVEVEIEAASINTREPQRDAHLRSPDFLNAGQFPYLTFKSKRIEVLGENRGRIIGDLTIRGISREVALDATFNGKLKNPFGGVSAGFSAATRINRKDWNLVWNVALETGGVLVGDEVAIHIELELVKTAEAEKAAA
ncbi:MAG: YceI family protein [Chloroflexota bacterium]|jgi:polyisoprenoid-binding protein YceI